MQNYLTYLYFIDKKIRAAFVEQAPYIFCQEGCSKCCKNSRYFYSKAEFEYLKYGFSKLDESVQNKVLKNIEKIVKERKSFEDTYVCPFLIDEKCSVYNYRGLICRTFGLAQIGKNNEIKVPFCAYEGLNYSNVFDFEANKFSEEKFKNLNIDIEPKLFNFAYLNLVDEEIAKAFGFEFGEIKPLIDWIQG